MSDFEKLIKRKRLIEWIKEFKAPKMKRVILMAMLMAGLIVGCTKAETATQAEPKNVSRFCQVEYMGAWEVVADRETGVMYVVSMGHYNHGTFTLLVDADGKPLIWEGTGR